MFPAPLPRRRIDCSKSAELLESVHQNTPATRDAHAEADRPLRLLRFPNGARFMSSHKQQLEIRIEGRWLKVCAAVVVRKALVRRPDIVDDDWTPVRPDFFGPVRAIDERFRNEQFSGRAIER